MPRSSGGAWDPAHASSHSDASHRRLPMASHIAAAWDARTQITGYAQGTPGNSSWSMHAVLPGTLAAVGALLDPGT